MHMLKQLKLEREVIVLNDQKNIDCKLDANESPYNLPLKIRKKIKNEIKDFQFNRYPDSKAKKLKSKLANYTGLTNDNILIGNGSDELLLLIMQTILNPAKKAVLVKPTFGMYEFYADMVGSGSYNLSFNSDFSVDWDLLYKYSQKEDSVITVLCSPNNPTGNIINIDKLKKFIRETDNYVLVDEAYYEFCGKTLIDLVLKYDNLLVTRTFSKTFGIAGLRIGYLACSKKIIKELEFEDEEIEYIKYERDTLHESLQSTEEARHAWQQQAEQAGRQIAGLWEQRKNLQAENEKLHEALKLCCESMRIACEMAQGCLYVCSGESDCQHCIHALAERKAREALEKQKEEELESK